MARGGVLLVPLDPDPVSGAKVGGMVTDGTFAIDATRGPFPGRYRVEIFWDKPTGKKVSNGDFGEVDQTVEGLPPKYNAKSELTAEITSGENKLDFALTP